MSTRLKKRRSTGRIYETEPNLNQVCFPPMRRTTRGRGPAWSAPSKYQQTITQMNPLRSFFHPNSEDEDLNSDHGDDEEEESYVTSPIGRKRRKITPARKTMTRSTHQQTITQMDPFRSLYHPESEDVDLKTEDEEEKENREPFPVKREPRNTAEKKKSTRIAKGMAKSQASTAKVLNGQQGAQIKLPRKRKAASLSKPQTVAALMPPPQTPRSSRKKEIPSSQSPADTPLSTQSRRSMRYYSRSPLKERSANVVVTTSKDSARWRMKLEVADSMESKEDDSPLSTRVNSMVMPPRSKIGSEDIDTGKLPLLPRKDSTGHGASADDALGTIHQRAEEIKVSSKAAIGKEILDSDEGDSDDDGDYNPNVESQAVLFSSSAPSLRSSRQRGAAERSSDVIVFRSERTPTHQNDPTAPDQPNPPRKSHGSKIVGRGSGKRFRNIEIAFTDPLLSDQPAPSNSALHGTESEQASAQLFGDLRRVTEPILETKSQFEGAWHSYHPADHVDPNDEPSNILSLPAYVQIESSPPMTVPTQPLPTRVNTRSTPLQRSTQRKDPVPPSQATTTDMTQPSPRKTPSSQSFPASRKTPASSHIQVPSSPPPMLLPSSSVIQVPSSPPPMPPRFSSPVAGRKATDPWMGFEWNGVRLTDSQLLPESLLNDSWIGPNRGFPGLSQEVLEEE